MRRTGSCRPSHADTKVTLSTDLKTDVTVHSGLAAPAPTSWFCFGGRCSVLPVPTAILDLHATDRGTLPVGVHDFDLAVGHIVGATPFRSRRRRCRSGAPAPTRGHR
jgi:hypothetical protein